MAEPSRYVKEAHLSFLYLGSCPFSHDPYLHTSWPEVRVGTKTDQKIRNFAFWLSFFTIAVRSNALITAHKAPIHHFISRFILPSVMNKTWSYLNFSTWSRGSSSTQRDPSNCFQLRNTTSDFEERTFNKVEVSSMKINHKEGEHIIFPTS